MMKQMSKRNAYGVFRNGLRNTHYAIRDMLLILILLTLTACGSTASADPTPPTIHYGEDACEFCGMIVSDERFAAGYITRSGESHVFDDIGDLFMAYINKKDDVAAFFVHDYNNHTWLRAETAHYVSSQTLPTPMMSGLAAFGAAEQAAAIAREKNGQVLTFEEVLAQYRQQSGMKY
jgi:copper chaperone NosL